MHPDSAEEYEEEEETPFDDISRETAEYGKLPDVLKPQPLKLEDSLKHSPKK